MASRQAMRKQAAGLIKVSLDVCTLELSSLSFHVLVTSAADFSARSSAGGLVWGQGKKEEPKTRRRDGRDPLGSSVQKAHRVSESE